MSRTSGEQRAASGVRLLRSPLAARRSLITLFSHNALSRRGDALARLPAIIMIDPLRYGEDREFRARMNSIIPRTMALLPRDEVRRLLAADTPLQSVDFDAIVPDKRRIAFADSLRMPDDSSPISASIYSLNSDFFTPAEARRFLTAVHKASPERRLLVLADVKTDRSALSGVTFIDNYSRPFTPWTRDPFIVGRDTRGRIVFINRPNAQAKRQEDQNMARVIAQQ